jgi:ferritin
MTEYRNKSIYNVFHQCVCFRSYERNETCSFRFASFSCRASQHDTSQLCSNENVFQRRENEISAISTIFVFGSPLHFTSVFHFVFRLDRFNMVSSLVVVSSIILLFLSPSVDNAGLKSAYEIQVQNEFLASNTYLTFAHRLATHGVYPGFAQFFFESAEEERDHGKKLIDFYNVRNRELLLYNIQLDEKIALMDDLPTMIRTAEQMERQVFASLIDVRTMANNDRDYATVHFIEQEMLEEQTTALKYMHDLVKRLERNAENSIVLLQMMDQDLRKKQTKKV